jgi:hypothetical protein
MNFWSKLSDTFPFNLLVDAICFVVIICLIIREQHKNHE